MIKWYDKLYLGKEAGSIADDVMQSIESGGMIPTDAYLITLSDKDGDQMELYSASLLYFPYHKRNVKPILGIAKGESEGFIVMLEILSDVYNETGNLNVKDYFKDRI